MQSRSLARPTTSPSLSPRQRTLLKWSHESFLLLRTAQFQGVSCSTLGLGLGPHPSDPHQLFSPLPRGCGGQQKGHVDLAIGSKGRLLGLPEGLLVLPTPQPHAPHPPGPPTALRRMPTLGLSLSSTNSLATRAKVRGGPSQELASHCSYLRQALDSAPQALNYQAQQPRDILPRSSLSQPQWRKEKKL